MNSSSGTILNDSNMCSNRFQDHPTNKEFPKLQTPHLQQQATSLLLCPPAFYNQMKVPLLIHSSQKCRKHPQLYPFHRPLSPKLFPTLISMKSVPLSIQAPTISAPLLVTTSLQDCSFQKRIDHVTPLGYFSGFLSLLGPDSKF